MIYPSIMSPCCYSIVFAILLVGCLQISGQENENFKKDTNVFYSCRGKTTNAGKFIKAKLTIITTCLAGSVTQSKYCQYRCIFVKLGMIDGSTGKVNFEVFKSELDTYEFFGAYTSNVTSESKVCIQEGVNYASSDNGCHNFRELFYCVTNQYIKVCDSKVPPKDINHASEEAGAVKNTMGTAQTAIGAIGVLD